MATIGVRELRPHASRWLSRVKAGERIVVTERRRPIAELIPIIEPPPGGVLAQLIEQGLASPATGDLLEVLRDAGGPTIGPPITPVLEALRADER